MHAFLASNPEMSKLLQRQALVDVQGFSLQHETSLAGVFGVSMGVGGCLRSMHCKAACIASAACCMLLLLGLQPDACYRMRALAIHTRLQMRSAGAQG